MLTFAVYVFKYRNSSGSEPDFTVKPLSEWFILFDSLDDLRGFVHFAK